METENLAKGLKMSLRRPYSPFYIWSPNPVAMDRGKLKSNGLTTITYFMHFFIEKTRTVEANQSFLFITSVIMKIMVLFGGEFNDV